MITRLKQKSLLWIHALGFGWRDRKEWSIEARWVVGYKVASTVLDSSWPMTMLFVKAIDVPSVLGHFSHGRTALHQEFP